jgi:puromycin-sensitive aminopeptidase
VEVRGIPVRSWSLPEKLRLASFGQTVALEVLPRLEDYFGLPYAFGKLDQVAVPDFEAGAMENAGLITYREVLLLLDPESASLAQKKRLAEVVTHELAHQWFGNWVTMAWWDDLWLNEAFATWMAFKIVDGWKPEWRLWLEFDASKAAALQLDALRATHPIRAEVHNAGEAGESFDAITYEKGGAVLRMIERYLGEAPFRDGIRAYMRKFAKANAVADDLWAALAESSKQPVLELANAWIRQAGFPLVQVSRAGGRSVSLTQRRFYSDPDAVESSGSAQRWPVPMIFRYRDATGIHEHRFLFTDGDAKVELPGTGELAWVCANAGAAGFFRVAYDQRGLHELAQHLGDLAPAEKVALLSDQWALVRAGKAEIAAFLDLCSAFGAEEDHAVLDELGGRLAQVVQRLVADRDRSRFQDFVAELLGKQMDAVGWDPKSGEDDAARLRRAALVRTLGLTARSQPVMSEAVARLERYLSGQGNALEPNLYDAAVTIAARAGDLARFDQFLARFRSETDPAFRRRFLFSLAAFEAAEPCRRAQELAFTDTVPLQEMSSYLGGLLANPSARDPFWKTLRERWDAIAARLANAPMLMRRVVEAMGLLVERRQLEEVEAFLATHPLDAATQAIAQTLEKLRLDVALRERSQEPISRWLDQRAKR